MYTPAIQHVKFARQNLSYLSQEPAKSKAATKDSAQQSTLPKCEADGTATSYWLMKAEPESRFERGVDVKFSIDDLASRTEPEPWDGEIAR